MGARGVVVIVTDSILTSSKVQSLSLLQLKRMHLMHLMHFDSLVVAVVIREFLTQF